MAQIKLIAGLGNPGPEYQNTRHNAGAIALEQIADHYHSTLKPEKKFHGLYAKALINSQDVHLLFPSTYMNRSGTALQALCQFYKIAPEEVLVLHDELDIPTGHIRLKQGGGHGGNNGLRDIIEKFGGNKNFKRVRIGIGHPGHSTKVTGHVLSKPSPHEQTLIQQCIDELISQLPEIIGGSWQKATQALNSYKAQ